MNITKTIKLEFQHYESDIDLNNFDILCIEKVEHVNKVIGCSLVTIEITDITGISETIIKFEWLDSHYQLCHEDFYFVPETDVLFFRSTYQWGAFNLKSNSMIRHESALCVPYITRNRDFILIEDELYAESVKLNAERIDNVPIDPPWEVQKFDDRIEYTSIVYGHQILKTK